MTSIFLLIALSSIRPFFVDAFEGMRSVGGRLSIRSSFRLPRTQFRRFSSPSSSTAFSWETEWYPVIPEQDLKKNGPNKITLLGKDFAVWFHSPTETWRVFADACPHRLVPLSEGRIESNGNLQCAYHGWEFDETGGCTRAPQLSAVSNNNGGRQLENPRACATSFSARVAQELLWIFPTQDEELAQRKEPALIPELDDPDYIDGTNFFMRDMPYSWDILVENLCDPAHVPFAHHSFMRGANREAGESLELNIKVTKEKTTQGFSAVKDPPPPGDGKYDFSFTPPCLLYARIANSSALQPDTQKNHDKNANTLNRGNFIGLGPYCIPTAPGQCRLIARFPLRIPFPPVMALMRRTPRWITHFSQNIVMDSDVVFLCSQDEKLNEPKKLVSNNKDASSKKPSSRDQADYFLPARSDTMVSAFRKWLGTVGGGQPQWIGIPATRSSGEAMGWLRPRHVPARFGRDALLDRYRQHTDICSSCRQAYKNLQTIREALFYAGVMFVATAAGSTARGRWKTFLAAAGGVSLLGRTLLLRPILARMECAPWPRRKWIQHSKTKR